jgi:heptosyltransferase-2
MKQRYLVIQTAFTGDAILATAVLEKLHLEFPEATIDILVRKGNEGLFVNHPFLNAVLIWNKQENKLLHLLKMLFTIRANKYDKAINLHRFATSGVLTAFSGANEKIGFDKNPISFLFSRKVQHVIGDGRHETERNQQLIAHFTTDKTLLPKLYPGQDDYKKIEELKKSTYVCIAPGSVWFTKTWPEQKWIELIQLFQQKSPSTIIYLLGAPSENALCERIAAAGEGANVRSMSGKLSLLESAALMEGATMNYVNDSAPLHLASAMNAPVTAIYCSTVPGFGFGPLSDNSKIAETKLSLACRPCGIHGHRKCPEGHFKCANSIEPAELMGRN